VRGDLNRFFKIITFYTGLSFCNYTHYCRYIIQSKDSSKNKSPVPTFSVKDRYQLNYFICIKDFNAETNTSLKLNLFSFLICCRHHQRKTICLYEYISDIGQIVGYRTPVFIQRFPWRLHITITYNLPHLRL
jgi:hypothetical protein